MLRVGRGALGGLTPRRQRHACASFTWNRSFVALFFSAWTSRGWRAGRLPRHPTRGIRVSCSAAPFKCYSGFVMDVTPRALSTLQYSSRCGLYGIKRTAISAFALMLPLRPHTNAALLARLSGFTHGQRITSNSRTPPYGTPDTFRGGVNTLLHAPGHLCFANASSTAN